MTLWDNEYTGPRWRYGITLRPVNAYTIPHGFILQSGRLHPDYRSFGTIDYPRELDVDECARHDLVFVDYLEIDLE